MSRHSVLCAALHLFQQSRWADLRIDCPNVLKVPALFELEKLQKRKAGTEANSLQVVLQQEAERYNALLVSISTNCSQLLSALKGIIVFSADLELVAAAFAANKVCSFPARRQPCASLLMTCT